MIINICVMEAASISMICMIKMQLLNFSKFLMHLKIVPEIK